MIMSAIAFDTLSASKRLREAGMDERAAEAIVELVQQTARMPDISNLATKDDLRDLATKAEISNLATRAEIATLATKAEIATLATKAEIATLATKAEIATLATKAEIADLATKAELLETNAELRAVKLELRGDMASLEARLSEKMRVQGWALMGGVAVLMTISTALIKLVP